jgi:hypothetical protein
MLPTTTAFDNFIKFHIQSDGDCKKIRRIETAVRGEELYRTFSGAPRELQKILFCIFDHTAWTLVSTRDHVPIPSDVVTHYTDAMASMKKWHCDQVVNGLAAFLDFVKKYVFSIAIQNTPYFQKLPEESTNESVRTVCDIFRACEHDVFPTFVRNPHEIPNKLPSHVVKMPESVPTFLLPSNDPLLVLFDAASILL